MLINFSSSSIFSQDQCSNAHQQIEDIKVIIVETRHAWLGRVSREVISEVSEFTAASKTFYERMYGFEAELRKEARFIDTLDAESKRKLEAYSKTAYEAVKPTALKLNRIAPRYLLPAVIEASSRESHGYTSFILNEIIQRIYQNNLNSEEQREVKDFLREKFESENSDGKFILIASVIWDDLLSSSVEVESIMKEIEKRLDRVENLSIEGEYRRALNRLKQRAVVNRDLERWVETFFQIADPDQKGLSFSDLKSLLNNKEKRKELQSAINSDPRGYVLRPLIDFVQRKFRNSGIIGDIFGPDAVNGLSAQRDGRIRKGDVMNYLARVEVQIKNEPNDLKLRPLTEFFDELYGRPKKIPAAETSAPNF